MVVVVGASAGGVEALPTLLAGLPAAFAAPVVIAQRLDAHRPVRLRDLLGTSSALPVVQVEDAAELQPGVVYLAARGRDIEVTGRLVRTQPPADGRPGPSIDRLFASAAAAFGEQVVAVVLSGDSVEGAAGAAQVKRAGGTIIAQTPASADYPVLPASLPPPLVDIAADLADVAPLLERLLQHQAAPTRPEELDELRAFLERLRERSGIDFRNYKLPTVRRRLQRRMTATQTRSLGDYAAYVEQHPEEQQRLVNSLLIKVTEFFRDQALFDYLREHILPELIEEARRHTNTLRLWSAGCATGEEAYSLAILVSELLGRELASFTVRIFATDLDLDAVGYARHGVYSASALQHLPPELVERYFLPHDGDFEIRKEVRALVVFGQHDLADRAPFPRIDLALCRNVLIYFVPELQRRTLQLFAFSLRQGGYLVLGKAETTGALPRFFAVEDLALKVYRRQGDRLLMPPILPAPTPAPARPLRLLVPRRATPAGPPGRRAFPGPAAATARRSGGGGSPLRHPGHQQRRPSPARRA